ncbi:unnamed protein product [Rotaria magnacalcarata]
MENQQSASPSKQPAVVKPTTTTTTEKTEKGFHCPKFLPFDETFHNIKEKLGLKNKKSNDTEKSEKRDGKEEKSATSETEKVTVSSAATTSSSEKKESEFHLNFISSLDDTFQNIKGKLGMEEKKPSDSEKSGAIDGKAAASEPENKTTGQPETAASPEKKESGFHLNLISSLDDTFQNIKGKLGMEEKKPSDTEKSGVTDGNAAASEPETAASSEKKESGFHLNLISSFDDTFQNIKGKLGMEEKKPSDSEKSGATDGKAAASEPEMAASSEKKESGFHLNLISSLDDTFQNIKGKLGVEEKKPSDSEKSGAIDGKAAASEPENKTTGQPETAASSQKKESGFHLNLISSFDDTFQNIKGKLRVEEKKPSDSEKSGATDGKAATSEPETAASPEKKESGFHLNLISSLDDTFQNIKGKLGMEEKKPSDSEKSGGTDGKAAVSEPETAASSEKKESGLHLPSVPSFENTFQNIKGNLGLGKIKSNETDKSEQVDAVGEKEADSPTKVETSTTNREKEISSEVTPSSDHVNAPTKF